MQAAIDGKDARPPDRPPRCEQERELLLAPAPTNHRLGRRSRDRDAEQDPPAHRVDQARRQAPRTAVGAHDDETVPTEPPEDQHAAEVAREDEVAKRPHPSHVDEAE